MNDPILIKKIEAECWRIEEDSEHSFKGHFNAADRWSRLGLWLGLASTILAAVAGGISAIDGNSFYVTLSALISSALVASLTFLKPEERADRHKSAGGLYQALRNQTRVFKEIELNSGLLIDSHKDKLNLLLERRDELNATMPSIPRYSYEKAKKDIDSGRAKYKVDKESK